MKCAFDFGKNIVLAIVDGIKSIGSKITETIKGLIPKVSISGASVQAKTTMQDFVWRPGSAPVPISANDTLIGTKSGANLGTVNVTNNYAINVSDKAVFERMLEEHSKKEAETLRRLVGA